MDEGTLLKVIEKLELNNFEVFLAENLRSAREIFKNRILKNIDFSSASYADSITMLKTGVLSVLKNMDSIEFIDTFNLEDNYNTKISKRKKALTVDLFLTGTNAITESGHLVNLDMVGNRIAPLTFGPEHVVLFIGKNKIVKDLERAMKRIKTISAPLNAKRHTNFKTPCQKTGICIDCKSPQRICNTWTITEKSYPKNRIKIILINEELGY
ncbi:MAG: lactate utilization protein [bacterium]|nr:lactate utilization protein [bacterium]